jgi:HrpA-like RNA helicase
VHERELFTDLLLTQLRASLSRHPQLRLVLMSATLKEQLRLFQDYFEQRGIPVATVHIPSRTYEVRLAPRHLERVLEGAVVTSRHDSTDWSTRLDWS